VLNKIVQQTKKVFSIPELRNKLLFTLVIFFVFRFLAHIPVPAVDAEKLQQIFSQSDFLSLLNIFTGGTLVRSSIVAVGINPYITASIVFQLAGMIIPKIKEIQKDGESGRAKINQYTRLLAVPIAIIQSISILALLRSQDLLVTQDFYQLAITVVTLVAGSMIVMWLGELVSEYGIGNGISIIMLAGIASQLPITFAQARSLGQNNQYITMIVFILVFLLVIGLVVFMNEAFRKISIQYARRIKGGKSTGGQRSHLPVKVNVAGVMPVIFSVSLMMIPTFIARLLLSSQKENLANIGQKILIWFSQTSPIYMIVYFLLVFMFTFFTSIIFFNAEDLAEDLKKSGAYIPGIRPGNATKNYLEYVITRITLAGAIFLGLIALLPSFAQAFTSIGSLAVSGTSVLIIVSVILETAKQVDSMTIGQNYEKYV
jgi:preprotein translocase subunit SecY